MATLEAPDGTTLEIPDGLNDDQVSAIYAAHARQGVQRDARTTLDQSTPFQKFGVGVARPFVELGLGVKDLAGKAGVGSGLTDEDRDTLARMSQVTGGAATAGRLVGEGASLLAPGGVAGKVGTMLPRLGIPLAADVGSMAGLEALKAPTDDESRWDRALTGAEGAIGGRIIGKGLGYAVNGLKTGASDIARRFMDDGIPLTPGQAGGGFWEVAERNLSKIPFAGPIIRQRQQEALEAWNKKLLNDVAPGDITAAGHEGFRQATKQFGDAYEKQWDQPLNINTMKLGKDWGDLVDDTQQRLGPEASNAIHQKLVSLWENDLMPVIDKNGTVAGKQLQAVDKELGDAASDAARKGNGDVAKYLSRAREDLRDQYPDTFRQSLESLNKDYAGFSVLRRAGSALNGPAGGGAFTPAQLLSASKALDRSAGNGNTARGMGVLQPAAQDAATVFPKNNGVPASLLEKFSTVPLGLAARPLYSKFATNILTGRNPVQKGVQGVAENQRVKALTDALSQYVRPAQMGAAFTGAEDDQ